MRKHIINIGLPRCGTTWLWSHLAKLISYPDPVKENAILHENPDITLYREYYQRFDISLNFNTNLYLLDQYLINHLDAVATHVSIILRNPYHQMQSYYNLIRASVNLDQFPNWAVEQGLYRYADIISRWQSNISKPLQVYLYDDLAQDPDKFLAQYLQFCNLDVQLDPNTNYYASKNSSTTLDRPIFSLDQIALINEQIDQTQDIVARDLSHWKL